MACTTLSSRGPEVNSTLRRPNRKISSRQADNRKFAKNFEHTQDQFLSSTWSYWGTWRVSPRASSAVKLIDSPVQPSLFYECDAHSVASNSLNQVCTILTRAKPQIMKYLGAYLLLRLGGNDSPSAKDIKNVLSSVGIDPDDGRLTKLLAELKGKDLNDVCFSGLAFEISKFN